MTNQNSEHVDALDFSETQFNGLDEPFLDVMALPMTDLNPDKKTIVDKPF